MLHLQYKPGICDVTIFIQSAISMARIGFLITTAWPSTWRHACKGKRMGMCVACHVCHTAQERVQLLRAVVDSAEMDYLMSGDGNAAHIPANLLRMQVS